MQTTDPSVSAMQSQISLLQSQVAALLNHKHLGTDSLQVDYSNLTDIEKAQGKVLSIIAGSGISLSPSSGIGNVTITASVGLSNKRGTDTDTITSHSQTDTHTITHGLGRTVSMIVVNGVLQPNGVGGSGSELGYGIGSVMLDGSGNLISGMAMAYYISGSQVGQVTSMSAGNSFTANTFTSGGTAHMTVAVQNVTSTTFDILYTVTDNGGAGAPTQSFSVNWTVM